MSEIRSIERWAARLRIASSERWFFGRAAELQAIERALAQAAPGAPTVVVATGEPGIGKTRLAAEAGRAAAQAGAAVLYGRCDDGSGVPYQPFAEMLGTLGRAGTGERTALFMAVADALTAAAAEGSGLLVVVDDVHWADEATLLLLRHLLTAPAAPPALFLLGRRSVDPVPDDVLDDVLTEVDRRGRVTRLTLAGLSDADVDLIGGGGNDTIHGDPDDTVFTDHDATPPAAGSPGTPCKVTYGGRITTQGGAKATFGGNAHPLPDDTGKGRQEFQDHGAFTLHGMTVTRIRCSGDAATIWGDARIGERSVRYRIDLVDNGEPGREDTYRMVVSDGYDTGTRTIVGGNVQLHKS